MATDTKVPEVSIFVAAQYLVKVADRKLTNLEIQKLLYYAQMLSIGQYGSPIFYDDFEAWEKGPVNVGLYLLYKARNADLDVHLHTKLPDRSAQLIRAVWRGLNDLTSEELIEGTHWSQGAWSHSYERGHNHMIHKDLIGNEYAARRDEHLAITV